ncbi:MAG: DNA primase [Candidatus Hydrogenedentes bacterium]|nr:DNA primase [Candidatus Hydrogenedentota bacterium]
MASPQRYNRDHISEVLAAIDIVDVIGAYLELKPAGSRFRALCPFHTEKTPSFIVSRDRQMYHCFGCGKGGDAIAFIVEYEGLSFAEALHKLADRAGVRLPAVPNSDQRSDFLRTQAMELCRQAEHFYRETLRAPERGERGRRYLETRKLKHETVERFGVGYAPEGWSNLLDVARKKRFAQDVVEASGLFKRGERGSWYDMFRDRLIFPIRNPSGNTVAFGGRALAEGEAKYINSPETLIYKKGRVLYGLYEAREAIRREKRVLLVEGYIDLLRCFDAGIENVVATCGTALTSEQAAMIRRHVADVVVVYDGDAAGIQAALRGIGLLVAAGLQVRAMALPEGQDPDDFLRQAGAEAFQGLVEEAPDFITFCARMNQARLGSIEGKSAVAREMFAVLQHIEDQLRLDDYLKRGARELGLNEWSFRGEFEKFRRAGERPVRPREAAPSPRWSRDDIDFVAALVQSEPLRARARDALRAVTLEPGPVKDVLSAILGEETGGAELTPNFENDMAMSLYTAAATSEPPRGAAADSLVEKRLSRFEQEALRARAASLQAAIREAERAQDQERVVALLQEKVRVEQELREKTGLT